jgi:16S rRNA (guanine527-N7)-methyltransferase
MQANRSPSTLVPLESAVSAGLAALGFDLPAAVHQRIGEYLRLLSRWNRVYNLTGIRDPALMVSRHVLESAAIARFLRGVRVLDVGTGAGVPGLVLAIIAPQFDYCLLDSNGKKVRFLRHVVMELGMDNVEIVKSRIDSFAPEPRFDTVVARAVGKPLALYAMTESSRAPDARLVVLTRRPNRGELEAFAARGIAVTVERLAMPDGVRHAVVLG